MKIALTVAAVLATACTTSRIPDRAHRDRHATAAPARDAAPEVPDCGPARTLPATPDERIRFDDAAERTVAGAEMLYIGGLPGAENMLVEALFADPYRVDTHAVLAELYAIADRPGCVAILLDRIADLGAYPSRAQEVLEAAEFLRGAYGLAEHLGDPRVHAAAARLGARTGVAPSSFGAMAPGEASSSWRNLQLGLLPALPIVPAV
jgi:hypothetical protein